MKHESHCCKRKFSFYSEIKSRDSEKWSVLKKRKLYIPNIQHKFFLTLKNGEVWTLNGTAMLEISQNNETHVNVNSSFQLSS